MTSLGPRLAAPFVALWHMLPQDLRFCLTHPAAIVCAMVVAALVATTGAQSTIPPQTGIANPFTSLFSPQPLLSHGEVRRFVRRHDPAQRAAVAQIIVAEAQRQGVDPALALAVATQESGLRPAHVVTGPRTGRVGGYQRAVGTMQILPSTGRLMGCGNLRDTHENVRCGVRYLRNSLARYGGNIDLAVRSYHGGHDRRFWGRRNAHYARAVSGHMRRLGRGRATFFASSSGMAAGDNSHFERMMIERHIAPN